MIGEDEYLERIVAGIHAVTSSDADVSWNEVINGRQFDVVVRFALGTLRYLVLIEVKNKTRRASAQDLDAFVTKARDQNSNKAVFVSAAGFQAGAIEVGKRHGVDLFQVSFDEEQLELSTTSGYIAIRRAAIPIPQGRCRHCRSATRNRFSRSTASPSCSRELGGMRYPTSSPN